jgi:hypothetical protein
MLRPLKLHPQSQSGAVARIEVEIQRRSVDILSLRYSLIGDLDKIVLPQAGPSRRADELWRSTCFEAFLGDGSGYAELNFSPSLAWAAYRFDRYREGMRNADLESPRIEVRHAGQSFVLCAQFALRGARLGLSAVIEEKDGHKSCWALAHPHGAPDFHHSDCFALELPAA